MLDSIPETDCVPFFGEGAAAGCTAGRRRAPKRNKNAFKHGLYTADSIARRRQIAALIRSARQAPCRMTQPRPAVRFDC
jgi:hypothetical protein